MRRETSFFFFLNVKFKNLNINRYTLAVGPAVPRGKKIRMSVHKKFQPIRSSRLAGYRQHIYIRMSCFII